MPYAIRKIVAYEETLFIEGGKTAEKPVRLVGVAAVITNPWHGRGFVEELTPEIRAHAPGLGELLTKEIIRRIGKEVKSINDAPGFKAVAGHLPATSIVVSYTSPQYIEYVVDMVRDMARSADPGEGDEAEMTALVGKLPAGSVFARPIAGFISHGTTEDAGMSFTSKILFKKTE